MNKVLLSDLNEISASKIIDWERFRNKTILVTGANGMLPSYIVYALLYQNREKKLNLKVIAQVRNLNRGQETFKYFLEDSALSLLEQNVCIPYSIDYPVNYIIHAASQASPKYYNVDPVGTLMANIEGTINILKLAEQKKCDSVLFFSSAEVYGQVNCEWISESAYGYLDPTSIRSCYAESKRMGEQLCCSWNMQYGTHCKSVRPFHTFGPNMKLDDGRVFADFVNNIIMNKDIVLKSDGSAKRAFCYVTDATIAFFKILLDGGDGISYNVGNPFQNTSIKELAQKLIKMFPKKNLKLIFDIKKNDLLRKSAVDSALPDVSKLNRLGWHPAVSVEEGFRRVILFKESLGLE